MISQQPTISISPEYVAQWRPGLSKRLVLFTKEKGKLTNSDYQTLNDVSRETATRDLKELIDKQLIKPSGQKGAGAFYTLN
jgi:ATP-dependent DNA helicase RecG